MTGGITNIVTVDSIEVIEHTRGERTRGVVLQSMEELIDMFFGKHPLVKYNLRVKAMTPTQAEIRARMFVRAKNPFAPDFIGLGRTRRVQGRGPRNEFNVSVNVRG